MSNILILDNDPTVCSVTKASLRKTPHRLWITTTPEQALEIAKHMPIAIALMDVESVAGNFLLPEFLNRFQDTQIANECVIILTSSIGKALGQDLALKVGATAFFGKPFSPIKMRNFIQHVLAMEQIQEAQGVEYPQT
jgi:CheY-like chemotaxis protein